MSNNVDPFIQGILTRHLLTPTQGFELGALLDAVERRAVELAFAPGLDNATCGELRRKLEDEFSEELVRDMVARIKKENG